MQFFKKIKAVLEKDLVEEEVKNFTSVKPTKNQIEIANKMVEGSTAKVFFLIGFITLGKLLENTQPELLNATLEHYMKED